MGNGCTAEPEAERKQRWRIWVGGQEIFMEMIISLPSCPMRTHVLHTWQIRSHPFEFNACVSAHASDFWSEDVVNIAVTSETRCFK